MAGKQEVHTESVWPCSYQQKSVVSPFPTLHRKGPQRGHFDCNTQHNTSSHALDLPVFRDSPIPLREAEPWSPGGKKKSISIQVWPAKVTEPARPQVLQRPENLPWGLPCASWGMLARKDFWDPTKQFFAGSTPLKPTRTALLSPNRSCREQANI